MSTSHSRALAIEGRIADASGEPMVEAEVSLLRRDVTPHGAPGAHSDDRGASRVFGLSPGRHRACAQPRGAMPFAPTEQSRLVRTCHPASVDESSAADVVLTSEAISGIDIAIQRLGTYSVSGTVLDAAQTLADKAFV